MKFKLRSVNARCDPSIINPRPPFPSPLYRRAMLAYRTGGGGVAQYSSAFDQQIATYTTSR